MKLFRPSDQNLWSLWLAAEHAAARDELAAFHEPVPCHPCHGADPVALAENLRRQFRFFADEVGVGSTVTSGSSTPAGTTSPSASPEWTVT